MSSIENIEIAGTIQNPEINSSVEVNLPSVTIDEVLTDPEIAANVTSEEIQSVLCAATKAAQVTVLDSGEYFVGTTVESVLQEIGLALLSAGGETNTASNVGTAGVGVFKQKTGVDLEFKKINAGSAKITVTDDTGDSEIDIDVDEAELDIANFGGRSHTDLGDIGSNTHAQIDTHIASTSNPHSVVANQVNITDSGGYYTGTDIEAALQEVGASLASAGDVFGPGPSVIDEEVARFNGTGGYTIQAGSKFFINDSGRIATQIQDHTFTISGLPTLTGNFVSHVEDGIPVVDMVLAKYTTDNTGALLAAAKSSGTKVSPTAIADTADIFQFIGLAHDGTDFLSVAGMRFSVDSENQSVATGIVPTKFVLNLTDEAGSEGMAFAIRADKRWELVNGSILLAGDNPGNTLQLGAMNTSTSTATALITLTSGGPPTIDLTSGATVGSSLILVASDIGSTVQAFDAGLTSIAGLTTAADRMIYTTASDTYAVATLTSFARSILDDANQGAVQTTLGLVIGTDVQAWDTDLDTLAGLDNSDGNFIVGSATGWVVESGGDAAASMFDNATLAAITPTTSDLIIMQDASDTNALAVTLVSDLIALAPQGTVTSVAVSGSDGIEVDSGSPITSSGTIALGINTSSLISHIGGVLEDLNTLGAAASDGQFIVATGAGVFAYEDAETAAESMFNGASLTTTTIATDDKVLIQDTSNSNVLRTVTAQAIADLASGGIGGSTGSVDNAALTADGTGGSTVQASDVIIVSGAISGVTDLTVGVNGVDYNPGSDIDVQIITVGVTGTPSLSWDESEDAFLWNKTMLFANGSYLSANSTLNDTLIIGAFDTDTATKTALATFTTKATPSLELNVNSFVDGNFVVGALATLTDTAILVGGGDATAQPTNILIDNSDNVTGIASFDFSGSITGTINEETGATSSIGATDFWTSIQRTSTSTHTSTLPAISASNHGKLYFLHDGDSNASNNNITIQPTGADTINNDTSIAISQDGGTLAVMANNTTKNYEIMLGEQITNLAASNVTVTDTNGYYDDSTAEAIFDQIGLVLQKTWNLGQWGTLHPRESTINMEADGMADGYGLSDDASGRAVDEYGERFNQDTNNVTNSLAGWVITRDWTELTALPILKAKIAFNNITGTTDFRWQILIVDANLPTGVDGADTIPQEAVGIQFSTNRGDTNFQAFTSDGSSQTNTDTGTTPPASLTPYTFIILTTSTSNVDCYIVDEDGDLLSKTSVAPNFTTTQNLDCMAFLEVLENTAITQCTYYVHFGNARGNFLYT